MRTDDLREDPGWHHAEIALDAVQEPELFAALDQVSDDLPAVVRTEITIAAKARGLPDRRQMRQRGIYEIRPQRLDHVGTRRRYQSCGSKCSIVIVNDEDVGRGRRIELIIFELSVARDIPLLPFDEHSVAKSVVRDPGLPMLMSGLPRESYGAHEARPIAMRH